MEMSSVFLNVRMLKSLLLIYPNVIGLMLLLSVALAPLNGAVSKYLLHFCLWEEENIEEKFTKLHHHHSAACIFGWLIRMSYFVSVHNCLISDWFSGKQSQAAVMPLLLFLCVCVLVFVTLLNLGQHPQASGRLGQGENSFWRFPPSQQHMDTCLHSTSPIIPHSTSSSIKPYTPPTSTLWLLRRAQSTTVITIKHTPFALSHIALAWAPKSPHTGVSIHFLAALDWSASAAY